jgi:magnesium transporter
MPELGWRYGYALAWAIMIAVVVSLLVYFRKNGWIGGENDPES